MSRMSYDDAVDAGYDGPPPWVERRYQRRLEQHPDCRDPDHPGCDSCEGEDEEQETEND